MSQNVFFKLLEPEICKNLIIGFDKELFLKNLSRHVIFTFGYPVIQDR